MTSFYSSLVCPIKPGYDYLSMKWLCIWIYYDCCPSGIVGRPLGFVIESPLTSNAKELSPMRSDVSIHLSTSLKTSAALHSVNCPA